jgi:hypothetical protein
LSKIGDQWISRRPSSKSAGSGAGRVNGRVTDDAGIDACAIADRPT